MVIDIAPVQAMLPGWLSTLQFPSLGQVQAEAIAS
jgi:hypothetical protein